MNSRTAIIATAALAGGLLLLLGAGRSTSSPPQDLAEQVKALETRVKALESDNALLKSQVATHEALLARSFEWFRALEKACASLDGRLDSARANGFEKAGPNPRAKTDVLDGLKDFTKSLVDASPVKPEPKKPAPVRGRRQRSGRR